MAGLHNVTLLALHCLRAPLNPNPVTELDKIVNDLRVKYRTFCVEFHAKDGAVMLPGIFVTDFGEQIGHFASMVDPNNNQFDVLVEKINGNVYLTTDFNAIRDFYNVPLGGWVIMVFTGLGQFDINVVNRAGYVVDPPYFLPPMKFEIERSIVRPFVYDEVPITTEILSFCHDDMNLQINCEKDLTRYDVKFGFLMLPYGSFCHLTLGRKTTSVLLIDDCRNKWNCITMFGKRPHRHIKIGGGWKRMVEARNIPIGARIKIGAPMTGENNKIYLEVTRPTVF